MEEAVKPDDLIAWALAEAQTPGPETEPHELLKIVASDAKPLAALANNDRANEYFERVQAPFGFLDVYRTTRRPPTAEQRLLLVGLMRWLVRGFSGWREASDPQRHRLTALLVASRFCEWNGAFWAAFPDGLERNLEVIQEFGRRIANYQIDLGADGASRRPISDREAIEAFTKADIEGKWAEIETRWRQFADFMPTDLFLSQAVGCLNRFGHDELVRTARGIRRVLLAMQILFPLTVQEGLALALRSENVYLEFAAMLKALPFRPSAESTEAKTQQLVTQLLCQVAPDESRWEAWMNAFNRHPMRYPTLQVPLGTAMATVPETPLGAYVNSIVLTTTATESRKKVAECLRAFRASASPERRRIMWTLAHERWLKWDFGADHSMHNPMIKVSYSELDYAVVGYAVECISDAERDGALSRLISEFSSLPNTWHSSHSDFLAASYRLLSRLQPYAYSATVGSAQDWLREGSYSLPFDPTVRHYEAIQFGLQGP